MVSKARALIDSEAAAILRGYGDGYSDGYSYGDGEGDGEGEGEGEGY